MSAAYHIDHDDLELLELYRAASPEQRVRLRKLAYYCGRGHFGVTRRVRQLNQGKILRRQMEQYLDTLPAPNTEGGA